MIIYGCDPQLMRGHATDCLPKPTIINVTLESAYKYVKWCILLLALIKNLLRISQLKNIIVAHTDGCNLMKI